MQRRGNPSADRTEQNRATLKSLVKLEANKSCADCKRNKHPRWASWNLGIFICIRCSGIHRGMGTHISRVKSVDLDSWTDEQLASMLRWGNARANKYWESKLAPGHIPAEAKIENFIRTKYDSKRWVMDGGIPDPATLDAEGDDDVPLNVVQEKAKIERSASLRKEAAPVSARPAPQPVADLIDGDDPPPRPNTTGPSISRPVPPKAEPAPPKQTKPGDSLLGLDFFGGPSAPPARPSSNPPAGNTAAPSRPDLKQSILSLYASKPAAAAAPPQQHARQESFGGMQSPPVASPTSQGSGGFGGLSDAFGGLNFNSTPTASAPAPPPKANAFSGLTNFASSRSPPQTATSSTFGGGGSFFDAPKAALPPAQQQRTFSSSSGFGDFTSMTSPSTAAPPPKPAASSGMGDLFDLSMPASQPVASPKAAPPPTSPPLNSVFNLSSAPAAKQDPPPQPKPQAAPANFSNFSMDPWGSSDAWASSTSTNTTSNVPATASVSHDLGGWGSSSNTTKAKSPAISQDEDFGGWSSAAPAAPAAKPNPPKPLGNMGGDDLFSNVWE